MSLRKKVSAICEAKLRGLSEVIGTKVAVRLVHDVVMGMLAARSLMVSEICRTLRDDPAGLWSREKRICRGWASRRWDEQPLREALRARKGQWTKGGGLVLVDLTEVVKPYGKKFEHLDRVRDASDPQKHPPVIKPGYWLLEVYAEAAPGDVRPLMLEAISLREPGVLSLPAEVERYLVELRKWVDRDAVLVGDRGFDSHEGLRALIGAGWRFIVRTRGDRHMYVEEGGAYPVHLLAAAALGQSSWTGGYRLGMRRVRLGGDATWLWLIAYQKEGEAPLLLLVHDPSVQNLADAERCVYRYFRRWQAEDGIRFLKQGLGLESFRVLQLRAIRRLLLCACWAMTFLAELDDLGVAWVEQIIEEAFTFGEAIKIRVYHLCRGVARVLTGQVEGLPIPEG